MAWFILQATLLVLALPAACALAQSKQPAGAAQAAATLSTRLEFGGYYSKVDQGFGAWRGLNAELWLARDQRFVPGFMVDSQTRPTGTQQQYAFMSYMNWTKSFYTVQGVSGAPQRSDQAIYFPKVRYDVKGYWKIPPEKNFVAGCGLHPFRFRPAGPRPDL